VTSGSVYEQRQRSKNFNKAIFGLLREGGAYQESPMTLKNSLWFGTGETHVYACTNSGKPKCRSVFTDELMVDPGDGYYGDPRSKYRRKFVSKSQLKERYPEKADKIDMVSAIQVTHQLHDDMIIVVEAWHLGYAGSAGRHMICIDNCALHDNEKWMYPKFPHAVLRYERLPTDYWGIGVAEKLRGIQAEINFTIRRIRDSLKMASKPWIFLERGSKFNPDHLDNRIGSIGYYTGTPPIIQVMSSVAPEQFRHLQDLYQKGYEIVGVSQLSAQSSKPSGLDAAVALREYQDIETERFASLARSYEQYYIDLAEAFAMVMEHEYGDDHIISTQSKDNGLEKLRWGDVSLPKDAYSIQVWPQSSLPQKPEGRLQRVSEMMQAGFIDNETGLELLDFPDLESHMNIILAPGKLVFQSLEKMMFEDTEQILPEPYQNLDLCLRIGNGYYNWALLKEFPDDKLEMIRRYIDHAGTLQEAASQPPEMPPMPEQPMPPMPGEVPPMPQDLTQAAQMPVENMQVGV